MVVCRPFLKTGRTLAILNLSGTIPFAKEVSNREQFLVSPERSGDGKLLKVMNKVMREFKKTKEYATCFIKCIYYISSCCSSGILLAKKSLFTNPVPSGCGGGSVFFVSQNNQVDVIQKFSYF